MLRLSILIVIQEINMRIQSLPNLGLKFLILLFSTHALTQEGSSVSDDQEWRTPKQENLVYMQVAGGTVVIELAPFMAPNQVKRFIDRVKEGYYNNTDFYRVIDGFAAQGGDISGKKESKYTSTLKAEFTRKISNESNFSLIQKPDFKAPQTGFLNGFAAGQDPKTGEEWLLHCPGAIGFARDNNPDWGTGDFYITLGQAPRHLDRNMTLLGKVIYGMPIVQKISRANLGAEGGIIEEQSKRTLITSISMANDIPKKHLIDVQVQSQTSVSFTTRIANARTLSNEFFHYKGNGNLDICYYNLATRIKPD